MLRKTSSVLWRATSPLKGPTRPSWKSRYNDQGKKVHIRDVRDIENKVEAAIDWESARFTKPDKPLTAYQCWKKYYQDIDMKDTLKSLGFWEGK